MTPQTVTIRIPRKQSERIQFSKELYDKNPQEWEVFTRGNVSAKVLSTTLIHKEYCVVAVLNLDEQDYPKTYTSLGIFTTAYESEYDLFMRRKSDEKLPDGYWENHYARHISRYETEQDAHDNSNETRIALVHVTYAWEDQP